MFRFKCLFVKPGSVPCLSFTDFDYLLSTARFSTHEVSYLFTLTSMMFIVRFLYNLGRVVIMAKSSARLTIYGNII